ncbi:hypothetical protein ACFQ06_05470 [Tessaracoccus lubricantis]
MDGVDWVEDLEEFTQRWTGARVVLLTAAGLEDLPALPARPRVYVIVEAHEASTAILETERHRIPVEGVLVWPEAATWLREQLLI